jgi:hypothetical protein
MYAPHSSYLTTEREGYYFVENGIHSCRQVTEKVAELFYKNDIIKSPEVARLPDNEIEDKFLGESKWSLLDTQSSAKADGLRKLGWKSHGPSLANSLEQDIKTFLETTKA